MLIFLLFPSQSLMTTSLPLDNVLPQPASELICLYLGFYNDHRKQRCLALKQDGKRCSRKGTGLHFCPQHIKIFQSLQNDKLVKDCCQWEQSFYSLARILQGPNEKMRKYREPNRCDRCHQTWKECQCHCHCLECTPRRHLQLVEFHLSQDPLYWTGLDGVGFPPRYVPTRCCRQGHNRHIPTNHPNCEYCIRGRPCHKIDSETQRATPK